GAFRGAGHHPAAGCDPRRRPHHRAAGRRGREARGASHPALVAELRSSRGHRRRSRALPQGCDRGSRTVRVMPLVRLLLNILWIIAGGLWMAALWLLAAAIMVITIVGIPWSRAAFNIAAYTLLPFGHEAVNRGEYTGREDIGTGPLGTLGNLIWLVL